jgi:hypothetical protein
MKIFHEIKMLPEFEKDIERLLRRFITLEDDLDLFIANQLYLYHKLKIDNKGIVTIPGIQIKYPEIYKAIKFACKSLKGTGSYSGIRVVYAYFEEDDKIELIEMYYKEYKINEDRERILRYYMGKVLEDKKNRYKD